MPLNGSAVVKKDSVEMIVEKELTFHTFKLSSMTLKTDRRQTNQKLYFGVERE
jgi:hypothetical protein